MTYTCPCCGFRSFDEPPGSYAFCDVCRWVDDAVQLGNPCSGGGANGESLAQAQEAFRDTTPDADIDELLEKGFERDSAWRPLNMTEKEVFCAEAKRLNTPWPNKAIYELSKAYWNRNVVQEKT